MISQNQSIGMMQGAFFVPKGQLLTWINQLLHLQINKIQQLGTGAVYCQILDAMHPGKIPMQRVNFKANNQWQFIANFKILQQGFAKCKILKYVDIEKLSKSKYQDNLEFIQWMKRYFDLNNKNDIGTYEPEVARKHVEVDFSFVDVRKPNALKQRERAVTKEKESGNGNGNGNVNLSKGKGKNPYPNIRSKVNTRSLTVGKPIKHTSNFYLGKLSQIRDIIKNQKPEEKLLKIEEIIEEIQEELPNNTDDEEIPEMKHLETVPSKKLLASRKKIKTIVK